MVMTANVTAPNTNVENGLRPLNLRTDLGQLADLIELVFHDKMDESGRAAVREMRYMSNMGAGLAILNRLNQTALGLNQGYVWVEEGKLVGNASIYPAYWPADMGHAWIIANVGVHPVYQRRGIARQMMHACLQMIRDLGGTDAILQVDYDNHGAIKLYDNLGFKRKRTFNTWWRSALAPLPSAYSNDRLHITRRRYGEWRAEYDLVAQVRPNSRGGIGWLKPLHRRDFRPSLLRQLASLFSLNSFERLIIRSDDDDLILASLWIESGLMKSRTRLTLFAQPEHHAHYSDALLNNALRRFQSGGFVLEHPHDDTGASRLLQKYGFRADRTVWYMHRRLI